MFFFCTNVPSLNFSSFKTLYFTHKNGVCNDNLFCKEKKHEQLQQKRKKDVIFTNVPLRPICKIFSSCFDVEKYMMHDSCVRHISGYASLRTATSDIKLYILKFTSLNFFLFIFPPMNISLLRHE
ncbi:UNVERIFIED_CONTAM: hypothetical protein NCL1_59656 [Trichonephila clavipes]